MFRTHAFFKDKSRRAWIACALILALAFHGLIPLGYMPEANNTGATHPFLAMTICGGHAQTKDHGTAKDHDVCPFSVNHVFASTPIDAAIAAPLFIFVALLLPAAFALTTARRFGNSSPRAPPLYS
jgi:hypothetical protein